MSAQLIAPEHVCYVHCNFCNTILAVNVPGNNMINIVTVRCGHCANLLSVNLGALLQPLNPLHDFQSHVHATSQEFQKDRIGSSSKCTRKLAFFSQDQDDHTQILPIEPPEKRQRVPSAYNRFIKEEIQRIKVNNPEISHREAFSAAAKNWAHFPHIRFGLGLDHDNNKQKKIDEVVINENQGSQNAQSLF